METEHRTAQEGFALLITLIIVSVLLAVGLSLLNITLKQFTLSSTARESELAFHVANAGLECMQYHRTVPATRTILLNEDGNPSADAPTLSCTGRYQIYAASNHQNLSDSRVAYNYIYRYDIDGEQCIEASMHLLDARESGSGITRTVNEGFETISCPAGVLCTTIFSRGFNRGCSDLSSLRTVQREITIEF
ncbi:MAG: pilus assembly PilX N-terminal domain-containing protein [Candidatus Paceibacterota bacterium]